MFIKYRIIEISFLLINFNTFINTRTKTTMDLFEFPDDYKPERPLTDQEMDGITDYLKNHPLFMKSVPEDISKNQHLVALQALVEDNDPIEQAEALNKQANDRLKQDGNNIHYMKDAYNKYTQGINLKCTSAKTNAKLHANRAALNLKMKNYGKVVQDCKLCLKFDSQYIKGYYRYAKALIALQKYKECLDLLENRSEVELKQLKDEAQKKLAQQKIKMEEKQQVKNTQQSEIKEYIKKKNWKFAKRIEPLPEGAKLQFIGKELSIPLMIMYPEFKQFDIVASSLQSNKVRLYIKEMIGTGLPWDTSNLYNMETIEVFCEVTEAVLMRIPLQANIGQIAARIVIKQAIQLLIVCKNTDFYKFFTSQYKII